MRLYQKPSGRFSTVTAGIVKAARPGVYKMSHGQAYMHACLMLALGQCAQDIMVELSNLPSMRGKYRANKLQIASEFAQQRKRLLRGVQKDEAERFEAILCDIADNCDKRVSWLIATVRDELTQKVDYRAVEAGALLNENIKPDADKCVASLMMLVEDMKESTIEVLGLKREGGAE